MNFPNIPTRWDFALFIVGTFFIYIGITQSFTWLLFSGIIFLVFCAIIFGLGLLEAIYPAVSDREAKEILLTYFAICGIMLFIIVISLLKLYFGITFNS